MSSVRISSAVIKQCVETYLEATDKKIQNRIEKYIEKEIEKSKKSFLVRLGLKNPKTPEQVSEEMRIRYSFGPSVFDIFRMDSHLNRITCTELSIIAEYSDFVDLSSEDSWILNYKK